MPIISGGFQINRRTRSLSEQGVGAGLTLKTAAGDAWIHNPASSVYRMARMQSLSRHTSGVTGIMKPFTDDPEFDDEEQAEPGDVFPRFRVRRTAEQKRLAFYERIKDEAEDPTSAWVDRDHALTSIKDAGFTEADIPVSEFGANILALDATIKAKQHERSRQTILDRGNKGFALGTGVLATQLVVSAADPVNLAVSFIPVVPAARYASMLNNATSKSARAMIRLRTGALEGAVGAAAVEPLVLTAATQEQLDYGLQDSLINVAFGTVLGGGLHVGMGALGDAFDPGLNALLAYNRTRPVGAMPNAINNLDYATRDAVAKHVVGLAADDRNFDVDFIINTAERNGLQRSRKITFPNAEGASVRFDGDSLVLSHKGIDVEARPIFIGERGIAVLPEARAAELSSSKVINLTDTEQQFVIPLDEKLPSALRKQLAEAVESGDIDRVEQIIRDFTAQSSRTNINNARDLQKLLGKKNTPKPLATFLEDAGLNADAADALIARRPGVKPGNRPRLFKKDGASLQQARKAAIAEGYIPKNTSEGRFSELLARDLAGDRVFKPADAREMELIGQLPDETARSVNTNRISGNDVVGWSDKMESASSLRSFDAAEEASIDKALEVLPHELDRASLSEQMADLDIVVKEASKRGLIDADEIDIELSKLEDATSLRKQAYDNAVECLIGGGNG